MDTVVFAIELVGTFAFAVSGAMAAAESKLDVFGTVVLGATAAVGGGVLRDILLGVMPPVMFIRPVYVTLAVCVSLAVFALQYFHAGALKKHEAATAGIINFFDTLGLAVFLIAGCNAALSMGYQNNGFLVVFIGTLTGVGGGILRDIFIRKIPSVLRKKIYAVAAIAGGVVYYALLRINVSEVMAMLCGMAVVIPLRLLAAKYEWDLPRIPEETKRDEYV